MTVILDLVGSALIAAFVLLLGLRLNESVVGAADASRADLNVQETLVDIVGTIEYDFRKIGFGVTDPKASIVYADTTRLRFAAKMDESAPLIDTVEWYTGPAVMVNGGKFLPLYRKVNNGPAVAALGVGVTDFKLLFRDVDGSVVKGSSPQYPVPSGDLSRIWIIETTLKVESMYKVADKILGYDKMVNAAAFWRQTRLATRNIKRHG
jgi:hypothetical protein